MYLIDSSAWIEYFRKTGSPTNLLVRRLLTDGEPVGITEPVAMEILAGTTDQSELIKLERLVDGLPLLSVDAHTDYRHAARLYRVARNRGYTVRKMLDCLIAAVALRTEATLVHRDADFDTLQKVIPAFKVRTN
ncbi:type II toxin-antitoxin system VapC family toxin [Streptosporangium soli]|nr:PIN domain nuclease [Streptosporangium sp. KLBMP 9127]